ncbi:MAG: threonine--tRNA ligase [Bacilli bacterium]|nr:threonine--tRNA ligase [Bacilli bacterium]MDD7315217.1 threonine--tRNA ligase [Bacilli bacterium]
MNELIKLIFPDGSIKEFEKGTTPYQVAASISSSLSKKCVIAKLDDELVDMSAPLEKGGKIELLTASAEGLEPVLNHSCAHLLANAIKELYPNAMFGVGPAIEEGFYYDMDLGDVKLTEEDLPKIEKKMQALVASGMEIKREVVSKEEAKEIFKNDVYKLELVNELPDDEVITMYRQGNYVDLCRGPHVSSTKWLKHFKLLSVSGAYWRGDSSKAQLQRVYGTCFMNEESLKEHLQNLEERKKRDHRKLGKELELFMLSEYGPGFPFWLPNGMILRRTLENFWYKIHTDNNYLFVQTPIMLNRELWEISGHWFNYKENMYTSTIDGKEFAIKPMNCPGGMLVYKNSIHSYRDFPLRIGELGLVHRHEASGALNGLFRVRNFTQDDAHIFITEDQIEEEIGRLIDLYDYVYSVFGLKYHIELSTRPENKYIGKLETWDKAEHALASAMEKKGIKYILNPGDGAFYGPKLDFKLRDSMNRIWQCGTIQLDMNLPERFDLTYVAENGEKLRPIMLHRALFGSIERFIGILIEHYAGAFPLWLAPRQVVIIPVNNDAHLEYAKEVESALKKAGLRVSIDSREEKLNYKIRESQTKKIPYTLVLGDNEVNNHTITYRHFGTTESVTLSFDEMVQKLVHEVETLGK